MSNYHICWFRFLLLCYPLSVVSATVQSRETQTGISRTDDRYAYMLGCDDTVSKLDLRAQRQVASISLARKTRLIPTRGDRPGSSVDGCPAYGLVYTPDNMTLYTVSPETGSYRAGGRHFRLLAFHLPEMTFLYSLAFPSTVDELNEPGLRLGVDANGSVLVHLGSATVLRVRDGKLVPTPYPDSLALKGAQAASGGAGFEELNLDGYQLVGFSTTPDDNRLTFVPLQRRGDVMLIRYYGASGPAWAVAQLKKGTIVNLSPRFKTSDDSYHLTPGGENILVQETSKITPDGLALMGSRFALLDTAAGRILQQWTYPLLAGKWVEAISTSGLAILWGRGSFSFLPVGLRFKPDKAHYYNEGALPNIVCIFADR